MNSVQVSGDRVLSAAAVREWRADLGTLPLAVGRFAGAADADADVARWELLRALEELKAAAAAAQAVVTVELEASLRAAQETAGADPRDVGRGIAAQVGLARRDSPAKGARHLGLARALVHELPHTLEALTLGRTTEWRATLVARETACLTVEDRRRVDAELAARPGGLGALGDRGTEVAARAVGYRLDPCAATRRAARAESQRRVSLRPAPDTMSLLTGLLPVRQGVAVFAALTRHADSLRATGDARTRGQIMADTLVERLTGQAAAAAVPVEVQLVMTDHALIGTAPGTEADSDADVGTGLSEAPAHLGGYGPVPAPLARSWVRDTATRVWLRRLYTDPVDGQLVAMDSRRRTFTGRLRAFLVARDQVCRTPWCDAPIRHLDHVVPAAEGGPTSSDNGQGLCEACNHAKQAPGWTTFTIGDSVHTRTPTSRHHTRPPALSSALTPAQPRPTSRVEYSFRELLSSA